MIERAKAFAKAAHEGQFRKWTKDPRPYYFHVWAVHELVKAAGGTKEMQVAALLHDVLEDVAPNKPQFGLSEIATQFGPTVAKYVVGLTDVFTKASYPAANRHTRHMWEAFRLALESDEVKIIKLADRAQNLSEPGPPGFMMVYLEETQELLEALVVLEEAWKPAEKFLRKMILDNIAAL